MVMRVGEGSGGKGVSMNVFAERFVYRADDRVCTWRVWVCAGVWVGL